MPVEWRGHADLMDKLDAIQNWRLDISHKRAEIVAAIQAANREAREAGLDKGGKPLRPVKLSTIASRRRKGLDPYAPPFVPRHAASRAEAGLDVTLEFAPGSVTIRGRFVGQPYLQYHAEGRGRYGPIAVRNILGIPPGAVEAVRAIVEDAIDDQVHALLAGKAPAARSSLGSGFGRTFARAAAAFGFSF
jgi:hypothetical protein